MNQINDLPEPSTFGLDFDYSRWTAGTVLTLCNVPWSSDYRDIVHFGSEVELNNYLDNTAGPRISLDGVRNTPPGYPVRIPIPFNAANRYNYLRVYNPASPISGDTPRTFYYFINDVRFIAGNNTELAIQLDVWQSYCRQVEFGNCYVERGHIGIANTKAFDNFGRDYLTVPEGLDIGNEYEIVKTAQHKVIDLKDLTVGAGVLVTSTSMLEPPYGTIDNPNLRTAQGSMYEGLPNGCGIYYFSSVARFKKYLEFMADKPWITNCIVSVMIIPGNIMGGVGNVHVDYTANDGNPSHPETPGSTTFYVPTSTSAMKTVTNIMSGFRNNILPSRYSRLTKFLTSPYTHVEMTTMSGTPIVLKPELLGSQDVATIMLTHYAPPSPRMMFWVPNYNKSSRNTGTEDWDDEWLNVATGITDLPTFSVPNNSYLAYMASNAHGIAYNHQNADWSQQRALGGADLAAAQATAGISTSQALTSNNINATNQQTALGNQTAGYRAITGAATGLISGAMSGPGGLASGAVGALSAGANYAIDVNQANQSTAIQNAQARGATNIQAGNSAFIRDTNLQYAQYAANGDYANTIAGINAKVQDAKLIPPTTVGQVGGDAFNLVNEAIAIYVRVRTVPLSVLATVGEYWLRYGYAVNRFAQMPSDYQTMQKFTYWKLRETYIRSQTCPEGFRQAIRGIFEKGVTVWSSADDIGRIDIGNNPPKPGITL